MTINETGVELGEGFEFMASCLYGNMNVHQTVAAARANTKPSIETSSSKRPTIQ